MARPTLQTNGGFMYLNIFEWVMLAWLVSWITVNILDQIGDDAVNTILNKWIRKDYKVRNRIMMLYFTFPLVWGAIWLGAWLLGLTT